MLNSGSRLVIQAARSLHVWVEYDIGFLNRLRAIASELLPTGTPSQGSARPLQVAHHLLHRLHLVRESLSDAATRIYSIYF